jgi:leader peptidase (prepilin peptidase) / N-methyltransferase
MTLHAWGAIAAAVAGLVVSPLLASWTAALADGERTTWWRPRPVSAPRWATVAAVTVLMVLLATAGHPGVAWWILAAGGAVLAVVDAQTHLLPARFTYPLAAAVGIALVIGSMTGGDPAALLRAAAAAATIFAITMAIRFLSPPAMGLGDVRAATLTAGMLGWTGWITLWQGQLLIAFLGGLTAIFLRITTRTASGLRFAVPMGPAILIGSLLALWL